MPFRIVACTFLDNLSRNSCIYLNCKDLLSNKLFKNRFICMERLDPCDTYGPTYYYYYYSFADICRLWGAFQEYSLVTR